MTGRTRGAVVLAVAALALGAIGTATGITRKGGGGRRSGGNVARFATLTFGRAGGRAALDAAAPRPEDTPATFTEYRTPNDWLLRPAGVQLDTERAPTGVAASRDGKTVVAVNSGLFDEQITVVDVSSPSFTKKNEFTSDLYMGAVIDGSGILWVSTGSRNKIYEYQLAGADATCLRCEQAFPGGPDVGLPAINVIGYPGNMVLASDGRLFVAGNISVPSGHYGGQPACAASDICSVVNVVDVSDPFADAPPVHYVAVGRDAFGIALNESKGKLYVSNWADEMNPARGGGQGTVSVVDITIVDQESEVQVVPVGRHPTGVALSPDGTTLFVANSTDDSLSKLTLGTDGRVTASATIDVRTTPTAAPRAAVPLALGFSADGSYLLVGLAGQNAVEVRTAAGAPIPRRVPVEFIVRRSPVVRGSPCVSPANRTVGGSRRPTPAPPSCRLRNLRVPHTYIPTGWYPSAIAAAPRPDTSASTRVFVTDLKGIGSGPGDNAQATPVVGLRTQGILQVIDLPTDAAAQQTALDQWTVTAVENNNWGTLFKRTRRDAAANPCRPAPLPNDTAAFSKFLCHESRRKGSSPYHVLYVVKENKTFDAYFGDLKQLGELTDVDADPTFLLFGEDNGTKNQHMLARTFTLGDNFWADSEESTTGHRWLSASYANEFAEITWNPDGSEGLRGDRRSGEYQGSALGGSATDPRVGAQEGALLLPEERLVDLLADPATNPRGATFRIYSDDVTPGSPAQVWQLPQDIWGIKTTFIQHGRDLDFPDTDRAHLFLTGATISHARSEDKATPEAFGKEIGLCGAPDDPNVDDFPASGFCDRPSATPGEYDKFSLAAWVEQYNVCGAQGGTDDQCQSAMPNFIYMALPVDHTLGMNPGSPTPQSMVADNDFALGLILQELSKTPFWKNTLALIVEDDTQLTGDHVDSHRTFLLTAGGLSRLHGPQGAASHQAGSFPSMLKTVEVLFGLPSLTIYDRAAVPLHDFVVANAADGLNAPTYTAVDPGIPFAANPSTGALARLSQKVDWRIDRGDPELVTAILYAGLRGWPLPEKYRKLAEE